MNRTGTIVALAAALTACVMPPQQQTGTQPAQAPAAQAQGQPAPGAANQIAYQAQAQSVSVNGVQLTANWSAVVGVSTRF